MSDLAPSRNDTCDPGSARAVLRTLVRTLPGRWTLLASMVWAATWALGLLTELPAFVDLLGRVSRVAWFVGAAWFTVLAVVRTRRAFLWRVRRKLVLSYVFLGVVPVGLVVAFALAAGLLVHITVASYVFQQGFDAELEDVRQIANTSAVEIGRTPGLAAAVLARRVENLAELYPALSVAAVPARAGEEASETAAAGPWAHLPQPDGLPDWLVANPTFAGILLASSPGTESVLVFRAVVPTSDRRRVVIADLPLDRTVAARLGARTGAALGARVVTGCGATASAPTAAVGNERWALFEEAVAFIDCVAWDTGAGGRIEQSLVVPIGTLYARLSAANPELSWPVLAQILFVLGGLFVIIQGVALIMGGLLARSITSAVHELFAGTEHVERGDFSHRIHIDSRDQLGDLAVSFNRMSESVERLLRVQREKQRLEDELRIARDIQKSLLPKRPPTMAGLDIADLCEPAREVGGDYYDFFALGPRRLAVLVADVAGKGTSAALYMAELKGLMLALSYTQPSPRQLLIEVNRRLIGHLGPQSFITMTYAVIDLDLRTLVAARAGHTPLLVARDGEARFLQPGGLVLGLSLPDAERRFEDLLVEHTEPIEDGDVFVFYTDGLTEAMNADADLFGDEALAAVVLGQAGHSAAGIRERVLRDVQAFVGKADPHDDMTMVVVKVGDVEA